MVKSSILIRTKLKKVEILLQQQRLEEAQLILQQIIKTQRNLCNVWQLLADIALQLNDHQESVECRKKALSISPGHTDSWIKLAKTEQKRGNFDAAIDAFERAFSYEPDNRAIYTALIDSYINAHKLDKAEKLLNDLLGRKKEKAELHSAMGVVQHSKGNIGSAIGQHEAALALDSYNSMFFVNLAAALCSQGEVKRSLNVYRQGLKYHSANYHLRSGYLLALHYPHDISDKAIYDAHTKWANTNESDACKQRAFSPKTDPDKRLRIGYVSPDIRTHSVAYFLEPVIESHNRDYVEIICYSDTPRPDELTRRIEKKTDKWRDTSNLDNTQFKRLVLGDKIDLLVDLAGHTARNRLVALAQRLAPVQITYLGYPDTTGLVNMDYRLSDDVSDPPGNEEYYTEKLVHLNGCFLCYKPPADAPEPTMEPPVSRNEFVTFGSFNNLAKLSEQTVDTWSALLRKVPTSKLLIKNPSLGDDLTRRLLRARFQERGIAAERILCKPGITSVSEHLAQYAYVDIALDTYPYSGTTTSCEALWMGVPVLTLAGNSHRSRVGASLLECLKLNEWIASSSTEFLEKAIFYSDRVETLRQYRNELRTRMARSPLCDSRGFSAKLETSYRELWKQWCAVHAGQE